MRHAYGDFLAAASTASKKPMNERAESATREGSGHRILLVEDEAGFQEFLSVFLESLGYAVDAIPDGRSAIDRLRTHHFDVIITDLCMPGFDGMELLARLKQRQCSVPIIAMSGGVSGEMAVMLRAAELLGARRTLAKPFALADLNAALRSVLCNARGG